tara:strand:+ start:1161 stop:1388 length:228 start_codon:yes stop_codon:yes gene_type:complete
VPRARPNPCATAYGPTTSRVAGIVAGIVAAIGRVSSTAARVTKVMPPHTSRQNRKTEDEEKKGEEFADRALDQTL